MSSAVVLPVSLQAGKQIVVPTKALKAIMEKRLPHYASQAMGATCALHTLTTKSRTWTFGVEHTPEETDQR